ncbi:MAG TPA: hypothetical protein VGL97_13950 [Bryobacteraceae bacterium]|jgi:hypothetical protein
MASPAATKKKIPLALLLTGFATAVVLIAGLAYLNRPAPKPVEAPASADAKSYLPNLQLSDVRMEANENFMQQQLVEVRGKITNKGPRALRSVDVYCLFSGVDGKIIHRERLPLIWSTGAQRPLSSQETRSFRLPFDSLPDGWNQALPKFVIAQITFAD